MRNRTASIQRCTKRLQASLALCLLFACSTVFAQQPMTTISGSVSDSTGASLRDAAVAFESNGTTIRTVTSATGAFTLLTPHTEGTLSVHSPGFNPIRIKLTAQSITEALQIRLDPAPFLERIVVAAEDERIPTTPASQFALGPRELETSGALTIDDVLRQVPGFSLFRRSGSLTANPTAQGVSLRGVGATGASRALVLYDGIPLNTPFGGWVYWNRLPRVSIHGAEVHNGATSDVYGSGALGGVINITTQTVATTSFDAELSAGNAETGAVSFSGGKLFDDFGIIFAGQALRTSGYVLAPLAQRGAVDTEAGTADLTGSVTLTKTLAARGQGFLRFSSFGESRRNGTPLQLNDTRIWSLDLGADWSTNKAGDFSVRLYGSGEIFNQTFSAVSLDRNSESLTNRQHNPSQQVGFAFQWRRPVQNRQTVTAGLEGRDVRGHSAETTFNNSRITAFVDAGGRQRSFGLFAHDQVRLGSWFLNFGARVDRWSNQDGFSNRLPVSGSATLNNFQNRSETAFSPRFSLLKRIEPGFSLSASVYRAFRAPMLNELYRNFRVGNVVTNANAALSAERLTGGEAGIGWQTFGDRLFIRSNVFWSEITGSIANVTLSTTPALITRQRQNLGAIRARGFELSVLTKLARHWEVAGEYLLTGSTVLRFPANKSLAGLRVPQVPRQQFNFQITYSGARWLVGTQGRFVGKQFDDDQNALPLDRFFTLDAHVSRAVSENIRLFVAIQNLTGARYHLSATPVLTVGPPVLFRAGARLKLR